jgi:hypothetical protein
MEFGLDERAKIALKKGKLVPSQNVIYDISGEIQDFTEKTYKYLRTDERENLQH